MWPSLWLFGFWFPGLLKPSALMFFKIVWEFFFFFLVKNVFGLLFFLSCCISIACMLQNLKLCLMWLKLCSFSCFQVVFSFFTSFWRAFTDLPPNSLLFSSGVFLSCLKHLKGKFSYSSFLEFAFALFFKDSL